MNINTEKNIIAKNIIAFRKSLGLSQKELAEKSNLSLRSIAYYEVGNHSVPLINLIKISKALNVSISDLLESDHQKNSAIENVDVRWLKKIHQIKDLPKHDQDSIINYINMIIEKRQKNKTKKSKQLVESKN